MSVATTGDVLTNEAMQTDSWHYNHYAYARCEVNVIIQFQKTELQ